jgi:type IV fimbrial biogenesis protein FimT
MNPFRPFLRHARLSQRGITLVEACVVMAVTTVLAGTAAPGMRGLIDTRRLDGAATQLATDIQFVRTETVARNAALRLSLHAAPGGSCYVVHSGAANQCDCDAAGGPAVCHGDAREIRTVRLADSDRVSLQGNVGSLLFDPLHGTVSPTGTLRVVGSDGRAVHQIVNVMGRVRSCSPAAAMPGYRAC